jgi:predicted Zn-dependent protease
MPCILSCAAQSAAGEDPPVRAWQDTLRLPTYRLGEPSPSPDFAILTNDGANYPYPLLKNLTKDRQDRAWRSLNLENEYLSCRVLPDLGGHLYSCRDKRNGREMFYANPVVKPADIGLRGAWAALGIESNFPVGHTRVSISPVDFAVRSEPDGSGRAIVEDVDRITGMQWRVEFILRPASTVLEQRVTLYNRSAMRWPYYWWANAGVAFDDPATRMILPTRVVSTHTTPAEIVRWPVTVDGKDGTLIANHKNGGAWFAYASREPFFAVYKPGSRSGLAHYADPRSVPGKKLWVWGAEQDAWVRRELTDNFPSYIEMQAGLFQSQNTFEFLLPEQSVHFSEFWIPVFDLGGVTRVTPDAILNFERRADSSRKPVAQIELSATHALRDASIRVLNGGQTVFETHADLAPGVAYSKVLENPASSPYTIQVRDSAGAIVLEHVEGKYDADGPDQVTLGTVPEPFPKGDTAPALLARANFNELHQLWSFAWSDNSIGLQKFPSDLAFVRAAGSLALNLNRFEQAVQLLSRAVAADPSDAASAYGLGVAQAMLGQNEPARQTLSQVPLTSAFGSAAALQQALLAARAKDDAGALAILKTLSAPRSAPVRIGALELALLRRAGRVPEALERLKALYAADPADGLLRFERILLGTEDPDFWAHLAVDGERVLNLVDECLSLGSGDDALRLLSHSWPPVSAEQIEPGAVPAALHPLIVYYRAFVRSRSGQDATGDLRSAAAGFTRYVFPNRFSTAAVLESALKANPSDAHARLLLGRLLLNQMKVDEAIAQWQEARKINPAFPELARDLGQALTQVKKDAAGLMVVKEGRQLDPSDPELQALASRAGANLIAPPESAAPPDPGASKLSVEGAASSAMLAAAAGKIEEARSRFDPKIFTAEKQPDQVRQAWIEVQLQQLMYLARAGKCQAAIDGLFRLGNEDASLAFTMYGFDRYMKLAHFQYYAATVESSCHDDKNAKRRWTKVSRMTESLPSLEFVFPILAAVRLDPTSAQPRVAAALETVRAALAKADPPSQPALLFAEAVLLSASGKEQEAASRFQHARQSADLMIQYLSLTEMNQMLAAR